MTNPNDNDDKLVGKLVFEFMNVCMYYILMNNAGFRHIQQTFLQNSKSVVTFKSFLIKYAHLSLSKQTLSED